MIVLIYDHILTLPEEVQFIWTARPSIAKTLFLANRYLVPVTQIITAICAFFFTGPFLPVIDPFYSLEPF